MTLGDMNWGGLVALTLRNPRAAAAQLINWQLPRGVIWMALVLVSCMNAILAGLSELLFPSPVPLPSILMNPLMLFALLAGGLLVTVHVLHWAGRVVGGQGALEDIAIVLTWLQALRGGAGACFACIGGHVRHGGDVCGSVDHGQFHRTGAVLCLRMEGLWADGRPDDRLYLRNNDFAGRDRAGSLGAGCQCMMSQKYAPIFRSCRAR